MPTYDYACDACDHRFEEFQAMKDEPLTKCPSCGKKKLRRLFGTGAALLFKGDGFYITDYRSEGYKAAAKAEGEKSGAGASKASDAGSTGKASETPSAKSGDSGKK